MRHVAGTSPYPWPFDGRIDPDRIALVITGWDTWWYEASTEPEIAIANVERLAAVVAHTVTVAHVGGSAVRPARPIERTFTVDIESVAAAGIDGFFGGPLESRLRQHRVDTLLIAGLGFETTVHSTLRRANDAGFECLVVDDACALIDPTLRGAAISMIEMSGGIFGAVGATHAVVAALSSSQPTPPEEFP